MAVITVIGSLNTDLVTVAPRIPVPGETLRATSFFSGCGGKGANQAVAAARLSKSHDQVSSSLSWPSLVQVRMVGAVGADVFGETLLKSLANDGVDVTAVRKIEREMTGTATIIVEEGTGENRILFAPGANFALSATDDLVGPPGFGNVALFQLEMPVDVVSAPRPYHSSGSDKNRR